MRPDSNKNSIFEIVFKLTRKATVDADIRRNAAGLSFQIVCYLIVNDSDLSPLELAKDKG